MKPYNPIAISVNKFAQFFPLCADHFTSSPIEDGKNKQVILVQMPKAGVYLHAATKVIPFDITTLHQFELYRDVNRRTEHLMTMTAVRINHPMPCVVLDMVDFRNPHDGSEDCETDLTGMEDNELQNIHYERALRHSLFLANAVKILGKKPEELHHVSSAVQEQMRILALPYDRLREKIESSVLPFGYPRKGDVVLTDIPNGLNLDHFVEAGDEDRLAAAITEERAKTPFGRKESTASRPLGETGEVVRMDAFRKNAPGPR